MHNRPGNQKSVYHLALQVLQLCPNLKIQLVLAMGPTGYGIWDRNHLTWIKAIQNKQQPCLSHDSDHTIADRIVHGGQARGTLSRPF